MLAVILAGWMVVCESSSVWAKKAEEPELNATGEALHAQYGKTLEALQAQIGAELPAIDAEKKAALESARATLAGLKAPSEETPADARRAYEQAKAQAEADALKATRELLADVNELLASDKLDGKLMKIAILSHGTPAGLAEFAQQGDEHKALLDKLFADEALMRQILVAGGANGGEYGEAMQVYTAILEASERAREKGSIFQRLALGTALHQPWLEGKDRGSVNSIIFTDHQNPDGQVARYLHYEKAYLDKEMDPAFKEMNAWECRFITNDPYSNEELAWTRKMLRTFRPDHITSKDHSWRYVGLVKSDLPYCSTTHDDTLGLPQQQALALGGICGRRAFFGRFITRAFGIPARRSTQTGHAAMNMWTPNGWVVRLGAWWSMNWCGPQGGLDFLLDSQAREFPEYMQVLRAQWIGDALGEEEVSIRHYGMGGGFWNALAFYKKVTMVEDNKAAAADEGLASLTADEARLLGESDKILGQGEIEAIKIPDEDKKIVVAKDGTITVPAVACTSPDNNTDKVAFLQSWGGGMQIHYHRLGQRPEILRYTIEVPSAGDYKLTAVVAMVSRGQSAIFRINRRLIVNVDLPYSKGMWQESKPQAVNLRKGRNTVMLSFRAPNRGVSLKEIRLLPVK